MKLDIISVQGQEVEFHEIEFFVIFHEVEIPNN